MSRRADPARIDAAREAATRNRFIGEHLSEGTTDTWLAAWAEQAARDGLERGSAYWGGGLGLDRDAARPPGAAVGFEDG